MVFQRVSRIVGRAHRLHVHRQNQRLRATLRSGELRLRGLPDRLGVLRVNLQVDAQPTFQIQVNPLVRGIARKEFEDTSQCQPLRVVVRRLAGDEFLWNAAFALQFPDIVVGCALGVPDVGETTVFGKCLDITMVMGIQNRQLCDFFVEVARQRGSEQVVFVEECHVRVNWVCREKGICFNIAVSTCSGGLCDDTAAGNPNLPSP